MPIRMYHRTTAEAAAAIVAVGFRDGQEVDEEKGDVTTGVWLDATVNGMAGEKGRTLLEVALELTQAELEPYSRCAAWETIDTDPEPGEDVPITEEGEPEPFRWYFIPATVLNTRGKVRLVSPDEARRIELDDEVEHPGSWDASESADVRSVASAVDRFA
jgi:hypothetical protein